MNLGLVREEMQGAADPRRAASVVYPLAAMLALAEAALTAGKTAVRYGVASLGLDQASGVAAAAPWPWIIENRVQP